MSAPRSKKDKEIITEYESQVKGTYGCPVPGTAVFVGSRPASRMRFPADDGGSFVGVKKSWRDPGKCGK